MNSFFKNNALVLIIYIVVLFTAICFLLSYDKSTIHIYINQLVGNKIIDTLFFYITYLGDGTVAPILVVLVLVGNIRLGIYTAVSVITATLVSTLLKFCFYDEIMRPAFIFKWYNHTPLKYVVGEHMHIHNSFPSGHSTQAFAIFMCLVFFTKNNYLKFLFFVLAILTAFSRTYLSQHWLVDVTVGSIIGTGFSMVFYYIFIYKNKLSKLNKPLFKN